MAWIAVQLEGTLTERDEVSGQFLPLPGAVEAMNTLAQRANRLTVWSNALITMPGDKRQSWKESTEAELQAMGFPPLEVWTASFKPPADLILGTDMVPFDSDWPLALAQINTTLRSRGLLSPEVAPTGVPQ